MSRSGDWVMRKAAQLYLDEREDFELALERERAERYVSGRIIQAAEGLGYRPREDSHNVEVVSARNACARLMREAGLPLSSIGWNLGRDRSSVYRMLASVADWEMLPRVYADNLAVLERIREEAGL